MALPDVAYRLIGWISTTRLDRALHPLLYGRRGGRGVTLNLQAGPSATIQIGRRSAPARARELHGDACETAFERGAAAYPGYRLNRRNARHHIRIFRLEPA